MAAKTENTYISERITYISKRKVFGHGELEESVPGRLQQ